MSPRGRVAALLAAFFLCAPAGAGVFPDSPFSDKAAGTTAANFLKTPPSARGDALAGAYAATVDGSEALFWNPAGLARLEDGMHSDVSAGYDSLLEGAYLGALAYARPVSGLGVFGAGLLYASPGTQQGYSAVGDPAGKFTPNDLAFAAGYAARYERLAFGGAVKMIRSQLSDTSGTTFAVDAGLRWEGAVATAEGPIDIGASIANLGPALKMGGASDPLPFRFQTGASWHLSERVAAILDGVLPVDQDPYAAIALEGRFALGERLRASARGGYNVAQSRGVDGFAGVSVGFGLEYDGYRLDYAWVPYGDLGSTNRISLGVTF